MVLALRQVQRFGWRKDSLDPRDHVFALAPPMGGLPGTSDLKPLMPPIYDQLYSSGCVGNAVARAMHYRRRLQKLHEYVPSRMQIYFDARKIEGTSSQDGGCEIRDALKVVTTLGAVAEEHWPFDMTKITEQPPPNIYQMAVFDRATRYSKVPQTEVAIKSMLAAGIPVIFGFAVFASFQSPQTTASGVVRMPVSGEDVIGGHAVVITGHDDFFRQFTFANSYGTNWGNAGYGTLPYEYVLNALYASDFWSIHSVGHNPPQPLEI